MERKGKFWGPENRIDRKEEEKEEEERAKATGMAEAIAMAVVDGEATDLRNAIFTFYFKFLFFYF